MLFLILAYTLFALLVIRGLARLPLRRERDNLTVSVIIAAHNETERIGPLLECLRQMDYPADRWDVVIVDDRSTDATGDIVMAATNTMPNLRLVRVLETPPDTSPKKYALSRGIQSSRGEIIVTTDADCRPGPKWLRNIVGAFRDDIGMVLGFSPLVPDIPAVLKVSEKSEKSDAEEPGFLEGFQWLDSLSLAVVCAGAAGWRQPITASGRNFAYRRKVYDQVGGFGADLQVASGDDDLLLHRMAGRTTWRVAWAHGPEAAVPSRPETSWVDLFNARVRHVSKLLKYPIEVQAIAVLLAVVNLATAFALLGLITGLAGKSAILLIGGKLLLDYGMLVAGTRKLGEWAGLLWFPVVFVVHPWYMLAVGVLGLRQRYTWKNREYRP